MTTKSELPEQMPERIWIPRDQMHEGWFSTLPQGDTFVAYVRTTPTGQDNARKAAEELTNPESVATKPARCPICGDPAPVAMCCGGYACTKFERDAAVQAEAVPTRADSPAPDGSRVIFLLIEKLCNEAGAKPDSVARNLETIRALACDSASDGDKAREILDFYETHVGENRVVVSYPAAISPAVAQSARERAREVDIGGLLSRAEILQRDGNGEFAPTVSLLFQNDIDARAAFTVLERLREDPTLALDDHVAWCTYTYNNEGGIQTIVTCDSDAKGAFKVYRAPVSLSVPTESAVEAAASEIHDIVNMDNPEYMDVAELAAIISKHLQLAVIGDTDAE